MKRLCLTMIVKNEAPVIVRCLASVISQIDMWMIIDTGSTDGTQQIVREYLGKTGLLHERPWIDFAHNRNEALDLGRATGCEYLLMMDADHVLHGTITRELVKPAYYLEHRYAGVHYGIACVIEAAFPWRYEGVIHEYLTAPAAPPIDTLPGAWVEVFHDGARARDPQTYDKDAKLLERALDADPDNARYAFYLAQSLKDAGKLASALVAYKHRAMMPGWDEETWYAKLEYARLLERTAGSPENVERAYLTAYNFRPRRAETLVELARWHRLNAEWPLALLFARAAAATPMPPDRLFVDEASYTWRALDELAIAAYYAGERKAGASASAQLLAEARFPPEQRERIERNAECYR